MSNQNVMLFSSNLKDNAQERKVYEGQPHAGSMLFNDALLNSCVVLLHLSNSFFPSIVDGRTFLSSWNIERKKDTQLMWHQRAMMELVPGPYILGS